MRAEGGKRVEHQRHTMRASRLEAAAPITIPIDVRCCALLLCAHAQPRRAHGYALVVTTCYALVDLYELTLAVCVCVRLPRPAGHNRDSPRPSSSSCPLLAPALTARRPALACDRSPAQCCHSHASWRPQGNWPGRAEGGGGVGGGCDIAALIPTLCNCVCPGHMCLLCVHVYVACSQSSSAIFEASPHSVPIPVRRWRGRRLPLAHGGTVGWRQHSVQRYLVRHTHSHRADVAGASFTLMLL